MYPLKRLLSLKNRIDRKRRRGKRAHKRPFLLLEVLIAFTLVVMCVLPLISPHTYLIIQQKKFIHKVELDHFVNLAYADIVEQMYRNDIAFGDLLNGREFPIDDVYLERLKYEKKLPFKGFYKFKEKRHKGKDPYTLYLFELDFIFTPTEKKASKPLKYHYVLFVIHDLGQKEEASEGENDKQPEVLE